MKFGEIGFACVLLFTTLADTAQPSYKVIPDDDSDPYTDLPPPRMNPQENEAEYWRNQALGTLDDKLNRKMNTNKAKNIIFFLGDGMSVTTITAARIYQGQLKNKTGEEEKLFFETFPHTGLSKTYCTDKQVADSAATATAYMSGVKGNYRTIGVTANVRVADCESAKMESNRPSSIIKWAQDAGKATGTVTTARVTHASPAGGYAHVPCRDMESDYDVIKKYELDPKSCNFDIARQLIYEDPGHNLKVILGGGRSKFLPNSGSQNGKGERLDKDLIEEWKNDKMNRKATAAYVSNANELRQVDVSKTDYLLGLFAPSHMDYRLDNATEQPSLSEMTEKAINMLKKNDNGFFLFVEGARIDMAHHDDQAHYALDETVEFDKAIKKAYEMTNEEDTLIVVTADHAHTLTMSGYPARGHNIMGIYGKSKDGLPYSTLSYANGPGYQQEMSGKRHDLEKDDIDSVKYRYPATVPKDYETHGGDDVAVYASGPWSHLFTGNYEQNYIPIAEAYAAQIGPSSSRKLKSGATTRVASSFLVALCMSAIVIFKQ